MHKKCDVTSMHPIKIDYRKWRNVCESLFFFCCWFGNGIFKMICRTKTNIVLKLIAICFCHSIAFRQRCYWVLRWWLINANESFSVQFPMTVNTGEPSSKLRIGNSSFVIRFSIWWERTNFSTTFIHAIKFSYTTCPCSFKRLNVLFDYFPHKSIKQ